MRGRRHDLEVAFVCFFFLWRGGGCLHGTGGAVSERELRGACWHGFEFIGASWPREHVLLRPDLYRAHAERERQTLNLKDPRSARVMCSLPSADGWRLRCVFTIRPFISAFLSKCLILFARVKKGGKRERDRERETRVEDARRRRREKARRWHFTHVSRL